MESIVIGGGGRNASAAVLFRVPGSLLSMGEAIHANASLGN